VPNHHATVDVLTAPAKRYLVVKRVVSATPEQVFDAFTDPEQLMQWWWPNGFFCPSAEVDLRVGGTYRLAMQWPEWIPVDAQFSHYLAGEYYEIDRPHRIVMSGRAVNEEQGELFATLIEVTFDTDEKGTTLTVRQSYFDPLPPPQAMAGAEQGWTEQLDKLEALFLD
jgi:uncharacterized protein YndB with AHSA1/START domain